jgi:outer membrane protein
MSRFRSRNFCNLSLAVAAALAFAPVAFAQDDTSTADSSTTTSTTTPGKRFAVVAGYAHLVPKSDPGTLLGAQSDIDGGGAPTLSGSWYVNDNIAVELWGAAGKFDHRVKLDGAKAGTISQQPVALSGQYHFGTHDQAIRPYVGLGYYESNVNDEDFDPALTGDRHVGVGTPKGAIASAGVDFNINERWFARADARYMQGDADVKLAGEKIGEVQLDPWVVGVGIGTRF